MYRFIKFIFLFFPILFLFSCSSNENNILYIAVVHDGDTFFDSNNNSYRLFGVDTPEANNQNDGFSPTNGIERIYSDMATNFTKNLVEHKNVIVKKITSDKYSRIVAKVEIDNEDLAYQLVVNGLARIAYFDVVNNKSQYYSQDYEYYEKLSWAQYNAFEKKLGVWENYDLFKTIFPKASTII